MAHSKWVQLTEFDPQRFACNEPAVGADVPTDKLDAPRGYIVSTAGRTLPDRDGRPLSAGDRVSGDIASGRHVEGLVTSIRLGKIVIVWNENEPDRPRYRSGKCYRFVKHG